MVQKLTCLTSLLTLLFASPSLANLEALSKTPHNIEAVKDLSWFAQNTTRIYSLVKDIEYKLEGSEERIQLQSEFSSPKSSDECSVFDIEKKYSSYYYYQIVEEINLKESLHSSWFEGQQLMGPVTKKTVVYCFAN